MIKKLSSFFAAMFLVVTLTVSAGAEDLNYGGYENLSETVSADDPEEKPAEEPEEEDPGEILPEENEEEPVLEEPEDEDEVGIEPEENSEPEEEQESQEQAEKELLTDSEEEVLFSGEARAVNSNIAVKRIDASYMLNKDYAFAYGFRKGKTKLTVQNGSDDLLAKLDIQFGNTTPRKGLACDLSGKSESGKYVARYTNVGDYHGTPVDLRITITRWYDTYKEKKGVDGSYITPSVVFYANRIGANIIAVQRVNFKFDFLKTGTDTKINLKCHMTMQDIDNTQSVRFFDSSIGSGQPTQIYLQKNKYLTAEKGDGYTEIVSSQGMTENDDPKAWIQVDFENELRFGYYMGSSFGSSGGNSIIFLATPKVLGSYEALDPVKRTGERDQKYSKMGLHNIMDNYDEVQEDRQPFDIKAGKEYDYVIEQRVLPGTYSQFRIIDDLDTCLKYQKVEITTTSGYDVTSRFKISHDSSTNILVIAANSDFISSAEAFNDVTYLFRIKVKARSDRTIVDHSHNDNRAYWYIRNKAIRVLGSDSAETNACWVKGRVEGSYYVSKVDGDDESVQLEGAEFTLEQWDNTVKKYVSSGKKLSYNAGTKLYETGLLKRSKTNEGKFKIVETKAPEDYIGGWTKKFNLMDLASGTTIKAVNKRSRLLPGEIRITKKIREKDILWAHGNPVFRFLVTGKDTKDMEHSYRDFVEFTETNYSRDGEYAVLTCVISGIPEGTYVIKEEETLRYRFKSAMAQSDNVKISGKTGTAVLDKDHLTAAMCFENEKTRFDGYSHTDVIRNSVTLQHENSK